MNSPEDFLCHINVCEKRMPDCFLGSLWRIRNRSLKSSTVSSKRRHYISPLPLRRDILRATRSHPAPQLHPVLRPCFTRQNALMVIVSKQPTLAHSFPSWEPKQACCSHSLLGTHCFPERCLPVQSWRE